MAANNNYDNWERLVTAVLDKEHLKQIALNPSPTPSFASSSSTSSFTLRLSEKIVIELLINEQKREPKTLNGLIYPLKLMLPYKKTRVSKDNTRFEAMEIAERSPGVESVELRDGKKIQLVVTGEGIDFLGLVSILRQKVGYATLKSVQGPGNSLIFRQKIIVKVSMTNHKCRSKAMKTAVGVSGVESTAIGGNEKDQLVVEGDGIDAVVLTRLLRKNVAHAELVSVGEVKKEEAKPAEKPAPDPQPQVVWSYGPQPYYYNSSYGQYYYPVSDRDPSCTIM